MGAKPSRCQDAALSSGPGCSGQQQWTQPVPVQSWQKAANARLADSEQFPPAYEEATSPAAELSEERAMAQRYTAQRAISSSCRTCSSVSSRSIHETRLLRAEIRAEMEEERVREELLAAQSPLKTTRKQRKAEAKLFKAQTALAKIHAKNMKKQSKAKVKAEKSARKALKKARKAQTRAEHSSQELPKRMQKAHNKALKAEQKAALKAEKASRQAQLLATRATTYATTMPPVPSVKGYNLLRPAPGPVQPVKPPSSLSITTTAESLQRSSVTISPVMSSHRPSPTHSVSTVNTLSPTTPVSPPATPRLPMRPQPPQRQPMLRPGLPSLTVSDTDFLLSPSTAHPSTAVPMVSAFSAPVPAPNRALPPPLPKRPQAEAPRLPAKVNLRSQAEEIVEDRRREREYETLTRDLKVMQL